MCLILFAHKISEKYPLILASNRDEFYQRPTAPMAFWKDHPSILAGRDLEGGGTWLGINENGRFGAITNFRDPASLKTHAPSRGEIIVDYLNHKKSTFEFLNNFKDQSDKYNGFNLLFGDSNSLYWFSNRKNQILEIQPGVHGISNRFLNTPWPKVEKGKKALKRISSTTLSSEKLFSILLDCTVAKDSKLPDTGIGLEWERILSPLFITSPVYGTRASTVMLMDNKGNIKVTERTYDPVDINQFQDKKFIIEPC